MVSAHYATRRARERAERIERARRNLLAQRSRPASRMPTPRSNDRFAAALGLALGVTVLGHLGVAYAASRSAGVAPMAAPRPVQVRFTRAPEPAPVPQPLPPVPALAVSPAPAPRRAHVVPHKVRPPAPPEPVPAATTPAPLVGLSLDSTAATGAGPAFAVGQTLAGSTERTAVEARPVELPPPAPPAPIAPVSRNQRATPRAAVGVHVQPAQRLARVQPSYPSLLERQGIEADVTVRVQIGKDGQVLSAELVRGAEHDAFNLAALAVAHEERFSPETHDGVPVATSLIYTYRFRITP